jgi:hypothetical protein
VFFRQPFVKRQLGKETEKKKKVKKCLEEKEAGENRRQEGEGTMLQARK